MFATSCDHKKQMGGFSVTMVGPKEFQGIMIGHRDVFSGLL
jgi:hypothetical protein